MFILFCFDVHFRCLRYIWAALFLQVNAASHTCLRHVRPSPYCMTVVAMWTNTKRSNLFPFLISTAKICHWKWILRKNMSTGGSQRIQKGKQVTVVCGLNGITIHSLKIYLKHGIRNKTYSNSTTRNELWSWCLKVGGARKWLSGGKRGGEALLEMKLSNELQVKATRINEKSKCLSFCPKFLHFT